MFVVGIFLFILLIIVHEFGHYLAAKRSGVTVEEFGVFFPPRLYGKRFKKGGTLYTINALPLGGFVQLKGEHDSDTEKGSYGAASLRHKVKILIAGVLMNIVAAFAIFTILAWIGMPVMNLESLEFYHKPQFTVASDTKELGEKKVKDVIIVESVETSSPAEKAGLRSDDQIVKVADQDIKKPDDLARATRENAGKAVEILYRRDTASAKTTATLNADNSAGKGYLGVHYVEPGVTLRRSTWSAPIVGAALTAQYSDITIRGIGWSLHNLFTGHAAKAKEAVGGPIAVVGEIKKSSGVDPRYMLMLLGIISVSLAVLNILPIPPVDGGKLFVTLFYRLSRMKLTMKAEKIIYGIGVGVFGVLFILVAILDIKRLRG